MGRNKSIIIFTVVFVILAIFDIALFSGLLYQILVDKFDWILNNTVISFSLLFWLFIGIPALAAYFIAFIFFKNKVVEVENNEMNLQQNLENEKLLEKRQFIIAMVTTIILGILITIFILWGTRLRFLPFSFQSIQLGELVEEKSTASLPRKTFPKFTADEVAEKEIQHNISVSPKPENVSTNKPKSTSNPISIPKPTATPVVTTTPKIPQPPVINISYPLEMQSITLDGQTKLCINDVLVGGNTQGLQRKHLLNDGGWSSYTSYYSLCLDLKEGLNSLQMQYKNGDGDESTTYIRQFYFHRIVEINISLNGLIYGDINCNGIKDSGESGIGTPATVNITKLPEFYNYSSINSDNNGVFSYSGKIDETKTLILQPMPVSPAGYKAKMNYAPPSIIFSSSSRSSTVEIPQVPNENVGACQ